MKSRKVKAAAKSKSFLCKKKLKGNLPLVRSDSEADSDTFYKDEIDDFHQREDEKLSTDDELIHHDEDSSEEEEVLPITDDDEKVDDEWDNYEDEQDEKSDSEHKGDEDLPNPEAWGRKKSLYFNADFVDEDRGRTYREEDAEAARAEAEEALAIQKSVLSSITTANLGGNLQFGDYSSEEEVEEEIDWEFVTKQEKLKFLKKTCPEFLVFIREFKEKLTEVKDKLIPLLGLVKEGKIPSQDLATYIKTKYHLLLHICMNISLYMMLKSNDSVVCNHPVLQRIATYKKLLEQLENISETIPAELDIILEKLKQNEEINFEEATEKQTIQPLKKTTVNIDEPVPRKETKKKNRQFDTEAEKEILSLYMDMKEQQKKEKSIEKSENLDEIQEEPMEEDVAGEKRTITYQIAKNKGLVPHRKKEYRNPRVRHRMKYRKAKIRRKGQVREVIRELKRYEGEPTGISTHVVKSIKLK